MLLEVGAQPLRRTRGNEWGTERNERVDRQTVYDEELSLVLFTIAAIATPHSIFVRACSTAGSAETRALPHGCVNRCW